jgi:hypothetical protein
MTQQTEGAEVVEVALAAAFGHRADVVGVPETSACGDALQAVEAQSGIASRASCSFQGVVGGDGVDSAGCTSAVVPGEDLISKIAGVGPKTPLVNAVVAAEGATAFGQNLEVAPTTEREAIGPGGKSLRGDPAAGQSSSGMQGFHRSAYVSLSQTSKSTSTGSMSGINQVSSFWWTGWPL